MPCELFDAERAPSRRTFLRMTAAAAAAAVLPVPGLEAADRARRTGDRVLSFYNTHTRERLEAIYCCDGVYQPRALARIDHILRDVRRNEVLPIDRALLDLLHDLQGALGTREPIHVISGYRSPQTNAQLRERGGVHTGVAQRSLHMVGKAIDIRVPGVTLETLRGAARQLARGGVGYYPSSDFVHVDTGRVRSW